MADFCGICLALYGEMPITNDVFNGGDIDIKSLYEEHIIPAFDDFLEIENLHVSFWLCESCGLAALSIKKENNDVYLIGSCFKGELKNNDIRQYKIAKIGTNKELIPIEEEIIKQFKEKF